MDLFFINAVSPKFMIKKDWHIYYKNDIFITHDMGIQNGGYILSLVDGNKLIISCNSFRSVRSENITTLLSPVTTSHCMYTYTTRYLTLLDSWGKVVPNQTQYQFYQHLVLKSLPIVTLTRKLSVDYYESSWYKYVN